ncbi:MAG: glycosyltransferase family 4 protein [Ignavibacteriaceae bacterium]
MKIIFIGRYNNSELLSGPEKVAKRLFEHISITNAETEFVTYFFKQEKRRKLKDILFGEMIIKNNPVVRKLGIIKIISYLFLYRPRIIHMITFERFCLPLLVFKKILKAKFIYTVHGIYIYERQNYYHKQNLLSRVEDTLLEKLLFWRSDRLVFLSQHSIDLAKKYYNLKKMKIMLIPNGTSILDLPAKKSFILKNGIRIVFYDGSENSLRRGLEILIPIIDDKFKTKIEFTVIGSTRYDLGAKYLDLRFKNYLPEKELFEYLSSNDIYIDSLNFQSFPLSVLEAMSLGLIIITSNKSGISSYIYHGINGFIFNIDSPGEIKEIIGELCDNKYNLNSISLKAIETAKDLSWDKISKQYISMYQELIN